MAGGEFPDGSASRSVWRYDPCFDTWMEMASMSLPRSELGEKYIVLALVECLVLVTGMSLSDI